jgi:hypothetical protein
MQRFLITFIVKISIDDFLYKKTKIDIFYLKNVIGTYRFFNKNF